MSPEDLLLGKENDHHKWKAVKHLFESEEKKFIRSQVDKEGSSVIPEADNLLDLPNDILDDPPTRDLDPPTETPAPDMSSGIATPQAMDEDQVADMSGDFFMVMRTWKLAQILWSMPASWLEK